MTSARERGEEEGEELFLLVLESNLKKKKKERVADC